MVVRRAFPPLSPFPLHLSTLSTQLREVQLDSKAKPFQRWGGLKHPSQSFAGGN